MELNTYASHRQPMATAQSSQYHEISAPTLLVVYACYAYTLRRSHFLIEHWQWTLNLKLQLTETQWRWLMLNSYRSYSVSWVRSCWCFTEYKFSWLLTNWCTGRPSQWHRLRLTSLNETSSWIIVAAGWRMKGAGLESRPTHKKRPWDSQIK